MKYEPRHQLYTRSTRMIVDLPDHADELSGSASDNSFDMLTGIIMGAFLGFVLLMWVIG